MPRSHPLALFYQAGPDFNYLKYQEEKSHFDRLGKSIDVSVDRGIRELLYSNEDLARRNIKVAKEIGEGIQKSVEESGQAIERSIEASSEKLNSTLTQGFDRLSFDLQDVRDSVDRVAAICEIGFSEITLQLSNLNQSIEHLIEISKSPEQTWAIEQFDIARDAFRRHLYAESLQYIDRAISGFKGNAGYKLDHRFHILRGKIRLGNERNYDPAIVDPVEAANDFLAAAKYAEHQEKTAFAHACQLAGWAYYCANEIRESEHAIRRSLAIEEDNAFTRFLLAKVLFHQGEIEEATEHFARCIRADNQLIIRSGADPDFLNNYGVVRDSIELYRRELASAVNQRVQTAFPSLREKLRVVERYSEFPGEQKIDDLEEKTRRAGSASIETLHDINRDLLLKVKEFVKTIAATKRTISEKIEQVGAEKRGSFPGFDDDDWDAHPITIALVWLGGLATLWKYNIFLALLWLLLGYYPACLVSSIFTAIIFHGIQKPILYKRYQRELAEFEKKQDEMEESRNRQIDVLRSDLAGL